MNLKIQKLFQTRNFWLTFTFLSLFFLVLSIFLFKKSVPIINFKKTINQQEALKISKKLVQDNNLGPEQFDQCARFLCDSKVQNFLEINFGKDILQEIISENLDSPFSWQIRHFKEGSSCECVLNLSPDGKLYNFSSQNIQIDNIKISKDEAKKLVLEFLENTWNINTNNYKLIDSKSYTKSNKQSEYFFIFEKLTSNPKFKNISFRLSVHIKGNRITAVNQYIDIPKPFLRKLQQIESQNKMLSHFITLFIYIFYLIGCCFLSFLYLSYNNYIVSIPAIIAGTLIAGAQIISKLNSLPLIWFEYSPIVGSKQEFFLQNILKNFTLFLFLAIMYSLILMTAEGLTRISFGKHIQFWKNFKLKVASTNAVTKNILSCYLIIPFILAFILLTDFIGTNFFNWWIPSSSLLNSNILSVWMPSLGILSLSFVTAFWEECFFRAIPLSLGALIGQKFNQKKLGIIIAFIFQIMIFGVVHAKYITIPGYVRILELIGPSIFFGVIYLQFGLLPIILVHFLYDTAILSLPIFLINTSEMFIQKIIIIFGFFLPLILVFLCKLLAKNKNLIPLNFYNLKWKKLNQTEKTSIKKISNSQKINDLKIKPLSIIMIGLTGLFLFIASINNPNSNKPQRISETIFKNISPQKNQNKPQKNLEPQNFDENKSKNQTINNSSQKIINIISIISQLLILIFALIKAIQSIRINFHSINWILFNSILYTIFSVAAYLINSLTKSSFDFYSLFHISSLSYITGFIAKITVGSLIIGILSGAIINNANHKKPINSKALWIGLCIALGIIGTLNYIKININSNLFSDISNIQLYSNLALILTLIQITKLFLRKSLYLLFLSDFADNKIGFKTIFSIFLSTLILMPNNQSLTSNQWIVLFILVFLGVLFIYNLAISWNKLLIPIIINFLISLEIIFTIFQNNYSNSLINGIISLILINIFSIIWINLLKNQKNYNKNTESKLNSTATTN